MNIPLWFKLIWGAGAFLKLALCALIWRRGLMKNWPSLFAICLDEFIVWGIRQNISYSYDFFIYWGNIAVLGILKTWLCYDILRGMPASSLFPKSIKVGAPKIAVAVFFVVLVGSFQHDYKSLTGMVRFASLSSQLALALASAACIFSFLVLGFGFYLTTVRILIGHIIRTFSAVVLAIFVSRPLLHVTVIASSSIDTVISLMVTIYWIYAIYQDKVVQSYRAIDWASLAEQHPSTSEN